MRSQSSRLLIIAALILLPGIGRGGAADADPRAIFQQGNSHYQSGDFAAAERSYRQLIELGIDSGDVCYNLGNACFKQKKLGEAIYFWEKARRQVPGDPEVLENLQLANLLVVDRIEIPEDPLPLRLLSRAAHYFTVAQETRILLLLFLALNLVIGIYLLARHPRSARRALAASLGLSLMLLVCAVSLGWKIYEDRTTKEGVVVEQKVDVRSGPSAENITVVTVHEGMMVRVRAQANGWYQISLANGWTGWIPAAAIRLLTSM